MAQAKRSLPISQETGGLFPFRRTSSRPSTDRGLLTKDISLYINSPGGSITAGLAIYDTMSFIKPDVSTMCMGIAMSMGSLLLAAGIKGKRFSLPNSRILIHQPSAGFEGQSTDIEIHARERKRMDEIYAKHTGLTEEEVHRDMERDRFLDPEQALAYGLIDRVR